METSQISKKTQQLRPANDVSASIHLWKLLDLSSFLFVFSSKKIDYIGSMCSILALLKLLLLLRITFISDITYVESVSILVYYFAIL